MPRRRLLPLAAALVLAGSCETNYLTAPCTRPPGYSPCGVGGPAPVWRSTDERVVTVEQRGPGSAIVRAGSPGSAAVVVLHPETGEQWAGTSFRVRLVH